RSSFTPKPSRGFSVTAACASGRSHLFSLGSPIRALAEQHRLSHDSYHRPHCKASSRKRTSKVRKIYAIVRKFRFKAWDRVQRRVLDGQKAVLGMASRYSSDRRTHMKSEHSSCSADHRKSFAIFRNRLISVRKIVYSSVRQARTTGIGGGPAFRKGEKAARTHHTRKKCRPHDR